MKAKKSRVILSGVSLLLVLCLLVGGTMAWFTDTEKVDTNFTAGILDVSVKPGEEGKTALDFKNLRPMLYENFYKELDKNEWNNDVTQGGTTGLEDVYKRQSVFHAPDAAKAIATLREGKGVVL